MPDLPTIAFITLGCPKNEVDSDRMRALVESAGFEVTDEIDSAKAVIINTCSFIREATEESIGAILEIAQGWLPEDDERRLIVSGCLPSRYGEELATELPEVAAFVPVGEESSITEVLAEIFALDRAPGSESAARTARGPLAYLQVADGCHRSCAYCTIPAIRGPYRSRTLEDVVLEAEQLTSTGAREIVLIGQDTTAYGRDLDGDTTLADLVRAVARVPGVDWLRVMYAQPDGITDDLLATMASLRSVVHYLDIPLQHASAAVLRRMHRSGDSAAHLRLITRIREFMPDVALRTTVILGFPGETRSDVAELHRFLEEARLDYVGVFAFSPEEGTAAGDMPDQVPKRTGLARAQRTRDLADRIGFDKVAERVGSTVQVLVEGIDPDEGVCIGRWRGQAPEIDGVVLLDRGTPGDLVEARVVDALGYDVVAEVVT